MGLAQGAGLAAPMQASLQPRRCNPPLQEVVLFAGRDSASLRSDVGLPGSGPPVAITWSRPRCQVEGQPLMSNVEPGCSSHYVSYAEAVSQLYRATGTLEAYG